MKRSAIILLAIIPVIVACIFIFVIKEYSDKRRIFDTLLVERSCVIRVIIVEGSNGARIDLSDESQIDYVLDSIGNIEIIKSKCQEPSVGFQYSITLYTDESNYSFLLSNNDYYHNNVRYNVLKPVEVKRLYKILPFPSKR